MIYTGDHKIDNFDNFETFNNSDSSDKSDITGNLDTDGSLNFQSMLLASYLRENILSPILLCGPFVTLSALRLRRVFSMVTISPAAFALARVRFRAIVSIVSRLTAVLALFVDLLAFLRRLGSCSALKVILFDELVQRESYRCASPPRFVPLVLCAPCSYT